MVLCWGFLGWGVMHRSYMIDYKRCRRHRPATDRCWILEGLNYSVCSWSVITCTSICTRGKKIAFITLLSISARRRRLHMHCRARGPLERDTKRRRSEEGEANEAYGRTAVRCSAATIRCCYPTTVFDCTQLDIQKSAIIEKALRWKAAATRNHVFRFSCLVVLWLWCGCSGSLVAL